MKTIGRILAVILGVMVIISGFYCLFYHEEILLYW